MRIPLLRGRLLNEAISLQARASRRDQRRDGAALLARSGSRRQALEVRPRSGRRTSPGRPSSAWSRTCGASGSTNRPFLTCSSRDHRADGHRGQNAGDPDGSREAIRAEMRALDPSAPPYGILTVEQRLGRTVALRRLQTLLLAGARRGGAGARVIGAYGVIHQSCAPGLRRSAFGWRSAPMRRPCCGCCSPAA